MKYRLTWFEKGPKPFRGNGRGGDSVPHADPQRPAAHTTTVRPHAATTARANEGNPMDGAGDGFIWLSTIPAGAFPAGDASELTTGGSKCALHTN